MDDEQQIRRLIESWAAAVHTGALDTVLADHAGDIVMYDVPPPYEGLRGIDAYRETWPGFFEWQAAGASFEIESLDVVAGGDVAFAYALLRCGAPSDAADNPDRRLRLTLGLVKSDDRWVVQHEHHSFPHDDDPSRSADEVRAVQEQWSEQTAAKDLDGLMSAIADDVVSYEHETPLQYVGIDEVRSVCERGLEAGAGEVSFTVPDQTVVARGDLAVAWGLDRVAVNDAGGDTFEMWSRGTRVFRRNAGSWTMVHQHLSYPLDPQTGAARTDLRPD
ncbi:SgcJ/EcaC family oxidoreductase [Nocardioidaceae bacterium SCSIO 66511]|nr:SgcJ/EcaC family oxidoreductase [Nocardioidaceae bacterium SCSIO 66511]